MIAAILVISIAGSSHAHKAPSGWEYPEGCCMTNECRPIDCGLVRAHPDGSVSWAGLHFDKDKVKTSGDNSCHVCVAYGDTNGRAWRAGHCIFLSPTN
jgi:hypothetical protein